MLSMCRREELIMKEKLHSFAGLGLEVAIFALVAKFIAPHLGLSVYKSLLTLTVGVATYRLVLSAREGHFSKPV